jgi:hypothetical protein
VHPRIAAETSRRTRIVRTFSLLVVARKAAPTDLYDATIAMRSIGAIGKFRASPKIGTFPLIFCGMPRAGEF